MLMAYLQASSWLLSLGHTRLHECKTMPNFFTLSCGDNTQGMKKE